MVWPASNTLKTNMDAGTDVPASARADLLDTQQKIDQIIGHVSPFMQGVLDEPTAAAARPLLGVAPLATRIDVASAATLDLTANAPDTDDIRLTGTAAVTLVTIAVGRVVRVVASGASSFANNANITTQTGATLQLAAGDTLMLRATAANVVEVFGYTRSIDKTAALGAVVFMTGGTFRDYSGIPSWATRLEILVYEISTNGVSPFELRLTGSGGPSGSYQSRAFNDTSVLTSTTGILFSFTPAAARSYSAVITAIKNQNSLNDWAITGHFYNEDLSVAGVVVGKQNSMAGVLTGFRVTTQNGTDVFDSFGNINARWS